MADFKYQALTSAGELVQGQITADSAHHARQLLRRSGLLPTALTPRRRSLWRALQHYWVPRLPPRVLALIVRQLAVLLKAGIPLAEALLAVSQQQDKANQKEVLLDLHQQVQEGQTLANAMQQRPQQFSSVFPATIRAGETSGQLESVLEPLADYLERQLRISEKIQQALLYPAIMAVVALAIVSFLLAYVVPKILAVFTNNQQSLPILTLFLLSLSDFLAHYKWPLLGMLAGLLLSARLALRLPRVRYRWDTWLLRLPGIRYFVITSHTARFLRSLAILTQAGVDLLNALHIAKPLLTNQALQERLQPVLQQVSEGQPLARALEKTSLFTAITLHLVTSGEQTGELAAMLTFAADEQDKALTRVIDTGLTLFEPMVILVMGGIVLFIVLAVLLPIFEMNQILR